MKAAQKEIGVDMVESRAAALSNAIGNHWRHVAWIDGRQIELNLIVHMRDVEQANHFLLRSAHAAEIAHKA